MRGTRPTSGSWDRVERWLDANPALSCRHFERRYAAHESSFDIEPPACRSLQIILSPRSTKKLRTTCELRRCHHEHKVAFDSVHLRDGGEATRIYVFRDESDSDVFAFAIEVMGDNIPSMSTTSAIVVLSRQRFKAGAHFRRALFAGKGVDSAAPIPRHRLLDQLQILESGQGRRSVLVQALAGRSAASNARRSESARR